MASPTRKFRQADWDVRIDSNGHIKSFDEVQISILLDLRDLLEQIDLSMRAFRCSNFLEVPRKLDKIEENTRRPEKRKEKA